MSRAMTSVVRRPMRVKNHPSDNGKGRLKSVHRISHKVDHNHTGHPYEGEQCQPLSQHQPADVTTGRT